jgi:hypothetical protein
LDNRVYKQLAFAVLLAVGLGVGRLAAYLGWALIPTALSYGVFCAAVMTVLEYYLLRDKPQAPFWEERE